MKNRRSVGPEKGLLRESGFRSLATVDETLDKLREEGQARQAAAAVRKQEEEAALKEIIEQERQKVESDIDALKHKGISKSSRRKAELRLNKYASLGSNYLSVISDILTSDKVNPNCMCETSLLREEQRQTEQPIIQEDIGLGGMGGLNVNSLLTKGQLVQEKWGAIHWAASKGHLEVIELLIKFGADVNLQTDPYLYTPLHIAAIYNQHQIIHCLCENGCDIEKESSDHDRKSHPLHMAALEGNVEAVETLVDSGADINATVSSGRTALLIAAANGRAGAMEILIQKKCDILKFPPNSKTTLWSVAFLPQSSLAARMNSEIKSVFDKKKSVVDFSECGLTHIPDCFVGAPNLRVLNFRDNLISTIPPCLFHMPFVQQIDLRGNKLPIAVVKALLENPQPFLQEMQKGRPIQCAEMKLMVVGQENIGKTTLLRWLRKGHDNSVSMNTITTDGIDIMSIALAGGGKVDGGITFRAWDFAGQEVYYQTHQFFLSENGIYALLWDVRKPPDKSRMEWWLQSVASRAHSAPIVLVGTHLDDVVKAPVPFWEPEKGKNPQQGEDPKKWLQRVQAYLKAEVGSRYPNIECITFFDGEEGRGLEVVKGKLLEIANRRAQSMPFTYLELADLTENTANRIHALGNPPIIQIEELYKIVEKESQFFDELGTAEFECQNSASGAPPLVSQQNFVKKNDPESTRKYNMKRLEMGLLFLHNMGRVVFFGTDKTDGQMAGMVVLQPQWLTRCLACIVTQEVKGTYIKQGRILHSDLVSFVWRSNDFPPHLHAFLLSVLEMFEVIFVMPNQPDIHIVPALLPPERPTERLAMFPPLLRPINKLSVMTDLLNRQYIFRFMPSGLLHRLFIRMMKHYSDFADCVYWRYGICLFLSLKDSDSVESHTYVLAELDEDERRVDIRVRSSAPSISSGVLLVVTGLIQNLIHEWYHLSPSSYEVLVPCLGCMSTPPKGIQMQAKRSKSFGKIRKSESYSLSRSSENLLKAVITVEIQSLVSWNLGTSSVTVAVRKGENTTDTVQSIKRSILKIIPEQKREVVQQSISSLKLYTGGPSYPPAPLAADEDIYELYRQFHSDLRFCFSPSYPLHFLSENDFTTDTPNCFSLRECEAAFMEGNTQIQCPKCELTGSLHALVPDVVLADVEQYGCEVVKEGALSLTKRIGRGAFGDVFVGVYKDKKVAVKQIMLGVSKAAEILKEFQKELRLGAMLNHPNVVRIEAFTMHPFQLVMEYIPCGDLYSYLNDPCGVSKYMAQIDTTIEQVLLPIRRDVVKLATTATCLPLNALSKIAWYVTHELEGEEKEEAEKSMASVSVVWSKGVLERRGQESVNKSFQNLVDSVKKMEDELDKKKGSTAAKLKKEAVQKMNQFWKCVGIRLTKRESEMTFEQAKESHQTYLDSMDGFQLWHSSCLQVLALPAELRIRLAIDIAAGMNYLHNQSPPIIHRDLKTPNVLLMSVDPEHVGPMAKVSDFGASAQMFMTSLQSGRIGSEDKAKKHVVTLTTWLAPEILVGQPYSKPSDVYAVGIMLWELLTRRHPFDHLGSVMNEVKVRQKVPSDDPDNRPPVPEDGPNSFCALLKNCWTGDPEARPPMGQVLATLIEMSKEYPKLAKHINEKDLIGEVDYVMRSAENEKDSKGSKPSGYSVAREVVKLDGKASGFFDPTAAPSPKLPSSSSSAINPRDKKGAKANKEENKKQEINWGPATCLTIAENDRQVWVGFRDGTIRVFNYKTGALLYTKQDAHDGELLGMLYLKGRVWSAGDDLAIRIWVCLDLPKEVVGKCGYLSKLSPSSKMREIWQKRYFVLDGVAHELRYYSDSKSKACKGSISLVVNDSRETKYVFSGGEDDLIPSEYSHIDRQRTEADLTREENKKGGGSTIGGGGGGGLGLGGGGLGLGGGGLGGGSMLGGGGGSMFGGGGVLGGSSISVNYDVSLQNISTSKLKFRLVTTHRVYLLRASGDENDKNSWMTSIIGAILRPLHPIHTIWLDSCPRFMNRVISNDERTEYVLIASERAVNVFNDQSFKRLHNIPIQEIDNSPMEITAMKPLDPFVAVASKKSIYFLNLTTMRQMNGVCLDGVKSEILCLGAHKSPSSSLVFAGGKSGEVYMWKASILRTGGRESPWAVLKTSFSSVVDLRVINPRQVICVGKSDQVCNLMIKSAGKYAENVLGEPNLLPAIYKGSELIGLEATSNGRKCFCLGKNGTILCVV